MKKWMRKYVVGVLLALSGGVPALAQSLMDPLLDNTLQVEATDGTVTNIYFNTDGSYRASDGETGAWTVDGATLCSTPKGGEETCHEIQQRTVGEIWTETDPSGNTVTLSIIAGR